MISGDLGGLKLPNIEVAHHTAYFVQFESKLDVVWLHEKHYLAWWRWFQGSSEGKSVSSGHQLQ